LDQQDIKLAPTIVDPGATQHIIAVAGPKIPRRLCVRPLADDIARRRVIAFQDFNAGTSANRDIVAAILFIERRQLCRVAFHKGRAIEHFAENDHISGAFERRFLTDRRLRLQPDTRGNPDPSR